MFRGLILSTVFLVTTSLGGAVWAQSGTITVQTWGGELGESFQKNVVAPFENETGIEVVLSYGMAADAAAKVRAQQLNPALDIAMVGQTEAAKLWDEGLLAPLDPAEIPNLNNLLDIAKYSDEKTGEIYYAGMYGYVLELIYRTDVIQTEVTSWKDLWKPELKGKVMFPSPAILSAHSQVMVARAFGGDERDMDPAWDAFKNLAPSITAVYRTDAETYNLVASGEAAIGPALMYTTISLQKANVPVARVSPVEGAPISWDGITLVKNGPNAEAAKKFINHMLSTKVVQDHVNTVATIPGVDGVQLTQELAKALPSTPEERARLVRLDDVFIALEKAKWIDKWEREIIPLVGR